MPYHLFKQLNISEFQLNRTTKYNINSASHRNEDAVLGTYIFNLNIEKSNKSVFICFYMSTIVPYASPFSISK